MGAIDENSMESGEVEECSNQKSYDDLNDDLNVWEQSV